MNNNLAVVLCAWLFPFARGREKRQFFEGVRITKSANFQIFKQFND